MSKSTTRTMLDWLVSSDGLRMVETTNDAIRSPMSAIEATVTGVTSCLTAVLQWWSPKLGASTE